MHFKKLIGLTALLMVLTANAAHAGITVWALVDNQTSSSDSLVGSGTLGTFGGSGPPRSIAANSQGGTIAFTPWFYENGFLQYGSCTIFWDAYVDFYYVDAHTSASGTGCTATLLMQSVYDYNATVVIRLDIT